MRRFLLEEIDIIYVIWAVNNQILSPETDVELKDGDIIRLSNEEFMFKNM